jgi:hypothetical protein
MREGRWRLQRGWLSYHELLSTPDTMIHSIWVIGYSVHTDRSSNQHLSPLWLRQKNGLRRTTTPPPTMCTRTVGSRLCATGTKHYTSPCGYNYRKDSKPHDIPSKLSFTNPSWQRLRQSRLMCRVAYTFFMFPNPWIPQVQARFQASIWLNFSSWNGTWNR